MKMLKGNSNSGVFKKVNDIRSPKLFMGTSLVLGLCALILNILGFSTPYWLQIWPRVGDTTFRNLGLWQVCIAGFVNPVDIWGKISYGCWWIFAREYDHLREVGYLLPPWFQAVQTFACFSFMTNSIAFICLIVTATTKFRTSSKFIFITAALCMATAIFNFITVVVFGLYTDRYPKWMPRPEFTFLSWSYICEVFSTLFILISGVLMICEGFFIRQAKAYYESQSFVSSNKSMLNESGSRR